MVYIRFYIYVHTHICVSVCACTHIFFPSDVFYLALMLNCVSNSSLVCSALLLQTTFLFLLLVHVVNVTDSFDCTK